MARRVLFILLSFVVFGSAMSSGYSYFMTRQAANDYRQTLIEKARVGAIVEEANRKENLAKDGRLIAERALKKLTEDYQKAKLSAASLEKKVAALDESIKEARAKKNEVEEALRSALENSKTADKVKDSSSGEIKALKNKLALSKKNQKKLLASLKKIKQDAAKEREAKNATIKAHAEAEKLIYQNAKELKTVNDKLKSTLADLSKTQIKSKKIEEELALLKKAKASDTKGEKAVSSEDNSKEIAKLRDELKQATQRLKDADNKVLALQKEQEAGSKKTSELEKDFEATKAELLKKVESAEKETAKQKAIAAKAIEAAKNKKTAAQTDDNKKTIKVAAVDQKEKTAQDSKKDKLKSEADKQADAVKEEVTKEAEDKDSQRQERAKIAQQELKRLGCYKGQVDGVWGQGSLEALVAFSNSANLARVRKYPTKTTVGILKSKTGVFCKVAGANSSETEKKSAELKKETSTTAEPPLQTLREQCLASCVGAFESIKSCRDNC